MLQKVSGALRRVSGSTLGDMAVSGGLPVPSFNQSACEADPADGWACDDDLEAIDWSPAEGEVGIPQYSAIYTEITGLKADTFYRLTLRSGSVGPNPSADYIVLGGNRAGYADEISTNLYYIYFLTPPVLLNNYLYIYNAAAADLLLHGTRELIQHTDVLGIPDPNFAGSVVEVTTSGAGSYPTWNAPRNSTGPYAGRPNITGGVAQISTGAANDSAGIRSDQATGFVVPGAPYRITWADVDIPDDAGARLQLDVFGHSYDVADAENTVDFYAGRNAAKSIYFNRQTVPANASVVNLTGPYSITRGAQPTPSTDITISTVALNGDDQGGTWNTAQCHVEGWLKTISQAGASFLIPSLANGAMIYRAWLQWDVISVEAGGNTYFNLTAQLPKATPVPFSGTNLPNADATTTYRIDASVGPKATYVTELIQELVDHANWSGTNDYINLTTGLPDGDVDCNLGSVTEGSPARLVIITDTGVF